MKRIAIVLMLCVPLGAPGLAAADDAEDGPKGAGAIVKGKDEEAITQLMRGFNKALKVKCNFCHVRVAGKFQFKKWTKKKRVALWMHNEFVAKLKKADGGDMTCNTCHQGRKRWLRKIAKGE
jgi:hypothetical protein